MNVIKKSGSKFALSYFPWFKEYPSSPKTEATISWDENCFCVHFVSYETNLRAVEREHNSKVCQDSCMELFFQFAPKTDLRYLNLEINPNCAIYSAIRYNRQNSQSLSLDDIKGIEVKSLIANDRWELNIVIPVEVIKKHIPTYNHGAGAIIRGNLYKCGDLTDHPHFGCFANIPVEKPDFHRPEYFAEFLLEE